MAFDDDSVRLLFELVADSTGVGPAVEHANAKVQELKTTFVAELGAVSTAGQTAFDNLTNHLSDFVSARLPLVGEGFEKTAEGFKEFAESSEAVEKHVEKLGEVIETIAEKTGKTEQEVGAFLKTLADVKDDGDRSAAALGFFGDATGSVKKELGEAGQEMTALTKATEEANSGLGSLLSPMGLLIGAAVALTGAVAGTIFELFELAEKSTAYGEEIFKAHLKTRLSIDTVGALKIAAHEAGESLESLNIGLLRFGHNLDSAAKGNETLARQLRGQGVESFGSVDKALEEYIAHLGSLQTEEEQSASISQIFGARFGARLIEVFHQVGGNLEAFKTELEETGHLMSEDSVRAAHEATVAHHQLEEEYAALTRRIGAALIPALLGVTTAIKSYPFVFAAAALAVSALATGIAALQFPRLISFIVGVGDNVVLLTRQMFGLAVAEDAVAVSTQALTLAWGGVAIIAITGLVIALSQYENATERANKLTEKQIEEQTKALEGSLKLSEAVKEVSDGQGESADRHEQLNAILNQLDPTTRTYINTLQTEEERIAALNETIKQHVEQNRDELISSLVTVGDGILDQVRAVDKNKAAIASLTEQVKGYQETLRRNPNNPQIQRDFNEAVLLGSKRIAELSEEQKRLNDELTKNEAKLALTGKALNLTADGLRDVFKAAGDTQDRVKLLGDIFQSFTPEVSKATEQLKEQADAWEKLRGSLAGTLDRTQLLNQEQQAGVIISEEERKAIEEKTLERQHDLDVATKAAEEENARNADLLKRGKITRAEESRDVIENLKKVAEAQRAAGEEALEQRVKELEKLRQQKADDPEKVVAANKAIADAQQHLVDVQTKLANDVRARETADLLQSQRDQLDAQKVQLTNLLAHSALEIQIIEDSVRLGNKTRADGEKEREALEDAGFEARRRVLNNELVLAGVEPAAKQKATAELEKLEIERTKNQQEQQERRRKLTEDDAKFEIDVQIQRITALNQLSSVTDERTIASLKNLGSLQVRSEEEVAARIVQIQVAALDREEQLLEARQAVVARITDPQERAKADAELTTELQLNQAKRTNLVLNGARDVEAARQKDVANLRRYNEEIRALEEETVNLQEQAQDIIIGLMTSFGASRASIIEKQYQLDASQQARRALADQRRIAEERRVTQDRIETIDHALKTLRADNAEEKKSIDALNDERAKAVEKLLSIDKKEEAERERNRLKDKEIEEKRKRDQAAASPTGALLGGLQSGQLKTLENGLKSFGDVAQVVMSAVGASIKGVSDGLGQLVQNWVLTGETGAHAMRKLVAQTLASVASQAAVLAIMSLAYAALATTVVGSILLGGTPAQFLEAAALFGAVAVVAGLAGRAVAGNLFKQNGASGTGGTGGGSIGGSGSAPTAGSQTTAPTIVQGRNQVASSPIVIHLRSNDSHIVRVVSQNVNDNGVLRELVVKTVGE